MGRPKGSPNKRNTTLLSELVRLGVNLPERIVCLLNSEKNPKEGGLSDRDKLYAYLELLQYVHPKLKSIELVGDPNKPVAAHIIYDTQFGDGSSTTDTQALQPASGPTQG